MTDDDRYRIVERTPTVDTFQRLRDAADMAERPRAGVAAGLPNSTYAVVAVDEHREPTVGTEAATVGMARVLSDSDGSGRSGDGYPAGGSVYHVTDMAVHPDHQRRGLGTRLMERIMDFIDGDAPEGAYVNLMADVDGFYERFGFEETRPASKGMYTRVGQGEHWD